MTSRLLSDRLGLCHRSSLIFAELLWRCMIGTLESLFSVDCRNILLLPQAWAMWLKSNTDVARECKYMEAPSTSDVVVSILVFQPRRCCSSCTGLIHKLALARMVGRTRACLQRLGWDKNTKKGAALKASINVNLACFSALWPFNLHLACGTSPEQLI
jgi:hypothetical protein